MSYGVRKIDGEWVECSSLKLQEMREKARRLRYERSIDQGRRAQLRLDALRAKCTHPVLRTSQGHTYDVNTCTICGQVTLT